MVIIEHLEKKWHNVKDIQHNLEDKEPPCILKQ